MLIYKKIIPLLSKRDRKEAEKLLSKRGKNPVSNYKGMWIPQPKPLRKLCHDMKELIKHGKYVILETHSKMGKRNNLFGNK